MPKCSMLNLEAVYIVLYVIKIVFLQNKNEIFFGFAYIFTISAIYKQTV